MCHELSATHVVSHIEATERHNMIQQLKGYRLDNAVDYHYGRFPPTDIDYSRLVVPLGRAAVAIGKYDAILAGLHNKDLLLAPLRRQEAVISSRIEGTIATLDEVLAYEAEDEDTDIGKDKRRAYRREIIEVHAYTRALNYAQQKMTEGMPICGRLLRKTHERMLFFGRGADKQPGKFKTEQNYVVDNITKEILFVPVSEKHLTSSFRDLEEYINYEEIDPLLQTAISHVEFEALHPFKDGNGRLGRILITLMLWNRGLISGPYFYISGQLEEDRDEYIARMRTVSSDNEWTDWCVFFLTALEVQANKNVVTAQSIAALYENMKEHFREILSSQWSINALDFIFGKPVFRNSEFTSTSGIPKPTAARFTKILVENGLLTTVIPPAGRRSGVYAFEPLLEVVRK